MPQRKPPRIRELSAGESECTSAQKLSEFFSGIINMCL